ncbi:4'-phosphopantetheinyl transferase [Bacillus coahuilensis m2-6]|uniref:holo-ACP synthase n=1 Tax=Bacillus coahuilensis TaxID=408580 RepID=UPI000750439B|nr:holo-ACP synthase [Bacillus coahuilensis]KUP04528.1 4'-phosphopantetheinyl transferase [Bacillus coahuilensis m2-6]
MIEGIGVDIIELRRIDRLRKKQTRFAERILTERELEIFNDLSDRRQTEFLAGRFAVKEAFSKAKGTGIGKDLSFTDIEVLRAETGQPTITLPLDYQSSSFVSISHSEDYAVAQVVLMKKIEN